MCVGAMYPLNIGMLAWIPNSLPHTTANGTINKALVWKSLLSLSPPSRPQKMEKSIVFWMCRVLKLMLDIHIFQDFQLTTYGFNEVVWPWRRQKLRKKSFDHVKILLLLSYGKIIFKFYWWIEGKLPWGYNDIYRT